MTSSMGAGTAFSREPAKSVDGAGCEVIEVSIFGKDREKITRRPKERGHGAKRTDSTIDPKGGGGRTPREEKTEFLLLEGVRQIQERQGVVEGGAEHGDSLMDVGVREQGGKGKKGY